MTFSETFTVAVCSLTICLSLATLMRLNDVMFELRRIAHRCEMNEYQLKRIADQIQSQEATQ